MFESCSNLTSFNGDLSSLESQYRMFANSALPTWDVDLPNLTNGGGMFFNCTNLSTFYSDLSSLIDGYCGLGSVEGMFANSSLSEFESSLKSLKSGYQMFAGCTNLTDKSIAIIAGSINDISGLDKNNDSNWTYTYFDNSQTRSRTISSNARGAINIGNKQLTSNDHLYKNCIAILQEKGWNVYIGESLVEPQTRVGATGYDCTAADASGWNSRVSELKTITTEMLGGIGVYYSGLQGSFYVDTQHIENGN